VTAARGERVRKQSEAGECGGDARFVNPDRGRSRTNRRAKRETPLDFFSFDLST
jgi:hypothetical protein